MPVILTTQEECEVWMRAPWDGSVHAPAPTRDRRTQDYRKWREGGSTARADHRGTRAIVAALTKPARSARPTPLLGAVPVQIQGSRDACPTGGLPARNWSPTFVTSRLDTERTVSPGLLQFPVQS